MDGVVLTPRFSAPTPIRIAAAVSGSVVVATIALAWSHIQKAAVNVVYADTWGYLQMIGNAEQGALRISDLFVPHNQNISPVLCLALLGSALFDHFNQKHLCLLGLAFAGVSFATLMAMAFAQLKGRWLALSLVVCCAAFTMFSLSQWENYLLPINFTFFSLQTFSILAILMISSSSRRQGGIETGAYVLLAVLFSELALLSMGGGVTVWFVNAFQLLYGHFVLKRGATAAVVAYCAIGLLSVGAYVAALEHAGNLKFVLSHLIAAADFFVIGTGNSIVGFFSNQPWLGLDFWVGLALDVAYLLAFWTFARLPPAERSHALLPICLILLGVLEEWLIILGRLPGGVPLAATARYSTLTLVAPVGALIFLSRLAPANRLCRIFAVAVGGAMIVFPAMADRDERKLAEARKHYGLNLQALLTKGEIGVGEAQQLEWPRVDEIVNGNAILRQYGLTFYVKQHGRDLPPARLQD